MARAAREATVADLTERFQSSSGAVLTEYRGLTVAQVGELRQTLGEHASFSVVKNTLTKIAAKDAGLADEFSQLLVGPSAIAFVRGDVVQTAKGLRDFSRTHPFLVIKGGIVDGRVITPAEIGQLADLESREALLARLAGVMQASLAGAAATFAALPTQMARLLAALQEKRGADGQADGEPPSSAVPSAGSDGTEADGAEVDGAEADGGATAPAADEPA